MQRSRGAPAPETVKHFCRLRTETFNNHQRTEMDISCSPCQNIHRNASKLDIRKLSKSKIASLSISIQNHHIFGSLGWNTYCKSIPIWFIFNWTSTFESTESLPSINWSKLIKEASNVVLKVHLPYPQLFRNLCKLHRFGALSQSFEIFIET